MFDKNEIKQKNILALAYYGDAVYELLVRKYLMEHLNGAPHMLHHTTSLIVCAAAQYEALQLIEDILLEEECDIVRRGRNSSKATVPRNSTPKYYRAATALEALFGYHALEDNNERIEQLFDIISEKQIIGYISRDI